MWSIKKNSRMRYTYLKGPRRMKYLNYAILLIKYSSQIMYQGIYINPLTS